MYHHTTLFAGIWLQTTRACTSNSCTSSLTHRCVLCKWSDWHLRHMTTTIPLYQALDLYSSVQLWTRTTRGARYSTPKVPGFTHAFRLAKVLRPHSSKAMTSLRMPSSAKNTFFSHHLQRSQRDSNFSCKSE